MSWKRRALRTFGQASLGVLVANLVPFTSFLFADGGVTAESVVRAIIVQILAPSIAAGCAAIMNLPKGDEDGTDI